MKSPDGNPNVTTIGSLIQQKVLQSQGRCKLYGTKRSFSNLYEDLREGAQKRKAEANALRARLLASKSN
jgi:hypothetical protein